LVGQSRLQLAQGVNIFCLIFGHRLLPLPRDVFAPIRCHRCGWTGP
jgi:hypothetical protein